MIFPCPDIGVRSRSEFRWGGYVKSKDEGAAPEWRQQLWLGEPSGAMREWWFHIPSETWYIAERDVSSETFISIIPADEAGLTKTQGGAG
jgi:sarcosine oxidase subunit delta